MKQIPRTTPTQVDSLVPDSGLIGTDSLNIPDPREYSISEVFIYIWDLLQVQLFTLQNTPVTFMKLLVFVLLLVGFSYLA
ncbi:MAG TPA: mechanosensitive ion channel protein MscS, partial [Balneolaceae bacterium]|nr:mechanosensitive ion channel protein MscS [Balneolaceae bacterium]